MERVGQCQCAASTRPRGEGDARRSFRLARAAAAASSARGHPVPQFHSHPTRERSDGMALVACPRCNITPPHASASRSRCLLRAPRSAASRPPPGRLRRSRAMAAYGGGHSAAAGADAVAAAPHAPPSLLVFSGDQTSPCLSRVWFRSEGDGGCGLGAWNGSVGGVCERARAYGLCEFRCLVLTIGSLCNE